MKKRIKHQKKKTMWRHFSNYIFKNINLHVPIFNSSPLSIERASLMNQISSKKEKKTNEKMRRRHVTRSTSVEIDDILCSIKAGPRSNAHATNSHDSTRRVPDIGFKICKVK